MPDKETVERTCNYKMQNCKPCGRPLFDSEHCIFHSKDIEGKKEKFHGAFLKEFESQKEHEEKYDFTGFVFPGNISFMKKEFEKDVYFWNAKFSGEAHFGEAQFSGEASFRGAQFYGETYFGGAQFSGEAHFRGAQFSRAVGFRGAQFSGEADFWDVQFSGEADFWGAQFSGAAHFRRARFSGEAHFGKAQFSGEADFWDVQFSGEADFWDVQFSGEAHFGKAQFSGEASFNEAKFKKDTHFEYIKIEKYNSFKILYTYFYNVSGLLEFIVENKKKFKYSKKPKLEFLPENFKLILGEEATARYPVLSRQIRDDMYLLDFQKRHPCWYKIWQCFANCGRKFKNLVIWCIVLMSIFAAIYCWFPHAIKPDYINNSLPVVSYIYYSIVTFSTLGFGDIVPLTWWMQLIVASEVIFGYIMLGGLISILANKLARRS